jgi:hypothetical protein
MTHTNNNPQDMPYHERKALEMRYERSHLLIQLRELGAMAIEIDYDGYDDSGSVDSFTITPSDIFLSDSTDQQLRNFGFEFALACNPGFEVDCGASGTLYWNLLSDTIENHHLDNGEERELEVRGGL